MNDMMNKMPEGQMLDDNELDMVSGGADHRKIPGNVRAFTYACQSCHVWFQSTKGQNYVHKPCGKSMKRLGANDMQRVMADPSYREVSESEGARV